LQPSKLARVWTCCLIRKTGIMFFSYISEGSHFVQKGDSMELSVLAITHNLGCDPSFSSASKSMSAIGTMTEGRGTGIQPTVLTLVKLILAVLGLFILPSVLRSLAYPGCNTNKHPESRFERYKVLGTCESFPAAERAWSTSRSVYSPANAVSTVPYVENQFLFATSSANLCATEGITKLMRMLVV
jgi:hypothetical protein